MCDTAILRRRLLMERLAGLSSAWLHEVLSVEEALIYAQAKSLDGKKCCTAAEKNVRKE